MFQAGSGFVVVEVDGVPRFDDPKDVKEMRDYASRPI